MKRQAKRSDKKLSPEKQRELRQTRERILREEKNEITREALQAFEEYEAARTELARAAELLKTERDKQGLSLADMQGRTGISRAAICRLENLVDANPTVATLDRIASALGKKLVVGLQDE
ncbi:MAG TPA: helix-turn-helix transcriptional regulator [Pirellulales bacterium]|jgi:DNA-binding phage protein